MESAGAAADDAPTSEPDHEAGAKAEELEEEEEGECPFCLYMKAGPCGKEFGDWEQCVEEAEKGTDEVVVRCRSITQSLMKCMEGFTDYYGLVLQAGEKLGQQEENVVERAEARDGSSSSSNRDSTDKDQKAESPEKDQKTENTEKDTREDQKADTTQKDQTAGLQVQIQVDDRKELAA